MPKRYSKSTFWIWNERTQKKTADCDSWEKCWFWRRWNGPHLAKYRAHNFTISTKYGGWTYGRLCLYALNRAVYCLVCSSHYELSAKQKRNFLAIKRKIYCCRWLWLFAWVICSTTHFSSCSPFLLFQFHSPQYYSIGPVYWVHPQSLWPLATTLIHEMQCNALYIFTISSPVIVIAITDAFH